MRRLLPGLMVAFHLTQAAANDSNREILLDLGEERPRQMLLLSAGYRGEWCSDTEVDAPSAVVGNAIHLFDIATGAALWSVGGPDAIVKAPQGGATYTHPQMTHSIVAPVAPADRNGNGLVDRAYVADTGGTLWRLTLPEAGSEYQGDVRDVLGTYTATPLAILGGEGAADRRFHHQVDYLRSRDGSGDYDGIFLVSGDRARPGETGVQDYAYLVKDRDGQPVSHDQLPDITQACAQKGSASCRELDLRHGWKLALQGAGEKGVSRPVVSRGVVYFTTYTPDPVDDPGCGEPTGEGQVYALHLADGSPATEQVDVGETAPETDSERGPRRSFRVGPGIPGAVVPFGDRLLLPSAGEGDLQIDSPEGPLRWRIYWREEGVDLQ